MSPDKTKLKGMSVETPAVSATLDVFSPAAKFTAGPLEPVGPVAPVAPVAPAGPVGPVAVHGGGRHGRGGGHAGAQRGAHGENAGGPAHARKGGLYAIDVYIVTRKNVIYRKTERERRCMREG